MDVLKIWRIGKIALIVVSAVSVVRGAQATNEDDTRATETQLRGYWADPSSGLMWAAKDNGKDVNWHQATSYCQKLRVGGYSDWRLPTIDQLEELIDIKAYAPEHVGSSSILHFNMDRKIHGGLLLTGDEWSGSQNVDDRGKLIGNAWSSISSMCGGATTTATSASGTATISARCVCETLRLRPAPRPGMAPLWQLMLIPLPD